MSMSGAHILQPPSRRTFARMVTVALFSDIGDRAFRKSVHNDVLEQPRYLLMTHEQADELRRTARMNDLVVLGDGSLVYQSIPVVVSGLDEVQRIYTDALDLRDLPTIWT